MSHRPQQIASSLHQAIQRILSKGLHDPRVRGLITVTEVRVASDLRDATVLISVTPEEHEELTLHGVKSAARHIRREAGEIIRMRSLPTLHFKLDRSSREHAAVIAAINRAVADLSPGRNANESPTAAGHESEQAGPDEHEDHA